MCSIGLPLLSESSAPSACPGRQLRSDNCGGKSGLTGAAGDIVNFFAGSNNNACSKLNRARLLRSMLPRSTGSCI